MDERRQRKLLLTLVGYMVVPSVILGVGLWGAGIRPAILDFSALSVGPAASVGVLGALAGMLFTLMPTPKPAAEDGTPGENEVTDSGRDELSNHDRAEATTPEEDGETKPSTPEEDGETTGSRTRTLGLVAIGVIALLAGAIASVTGEFNTYTILFWICVPYGAGIASLYDLFSP